MPVEFYIHKMSEHMETAEIVQWLAQEGDRVEQHQPLVEVMTDKFAVELEAPAAGILAGIRPGCVKGATVPVGEAIAFIVQPGELAPALAPFAGAAGTPAVAEPTQSAAVASNTADPEGIGRVRSTPVARRMAQDLGVDIERVNGTGPGGRVTEGDVKAFVAARTALTPAAPVPPPVSPQAVTPAPAGSPAVPAAATGTPPATPATPPATPPATVDMPYVWQDLTLVQRVTGERMRESVVTAPQFTLEVRADAGNLLWLRDALMDRVTLEARTRLSVTGLLVKIVAAALLHHPRANAEFVAGEGASAGRLKLYQAVNLGVAVGTANGLVVPVIKDAGGKSLAEVTRELGVYQGKAQTLHFTAEDLSGGTFTLSNLGMFGIERFQAIVNPPQSAILAVGSVVQTPVARENGAVTVRPLMSLSVTVDHRVLDGVQAAEFLGEVKARIERPYFLI